MLSFEAMNIVWSKEFISIAWYDEDFETPEEDATTTLKQPSVEKPVSDKEETKLADEPALGENKA